MQLTWMCNQVSKRAEKHARVEVHIKAGQIGIRGRPGPKGYEGPKGFQGPRGNRVSHLFPHQMCTGHKLCSLLQPKYSTDFIISDLNSTENVERHHEQGPRGNRGPRGVVGPVGIKGIKGDDGDQVPTVCHDCKALHGLQVTGHHINSATGRSAA